MFLLLLGAPKDRLKSAGQNLFKFTYHLYRSQQRCCSLKSYFENKFPIWPKISIYFRKLICNKKNQDITYILGLYIKIGVCVRTSPVHIDQFDIPRMKIGTKVAEGYNFSHIFHFREDKKRCFHEYFFRRHQMLILAHSIGFINLFNLFLKTIRTILQNTAFVYWSSSFVKQ